MKHRTSILVAVALACFLDSARQPAAAAEPQEIPAGNLMIVQTASAEAWYVVPHDARERSVIVITVSDSGDVTMTTQPLPDRQTPNPDGPEDDPDDPPPVSLQALVSRWADEVDDAAGRAKLVVAYQQLINMMDDGDITTPDQLVTLQHAANDLVLGGSAPKWATFFQNLRLHLNANPPADMAAYRDAWQSIRDGLSSEGLAEALQSLMEDLQ